MKGLKANLVEFGRLLFLLWLIQPGLSAAASAQETGTIRGTLEDRNGAVIPGQVIHFRNSTFQGEVATDESGNFQIELAEGSYELALEAKGFETHCINDFQVKPRVNQWFTIVLEPAIGHYICHCPCPKVYPEPIIERINAPVFQTLGPRRLK
jgi:hypothetical protein